MTASLVPLSAHPNALILKPGTFTPDVTATAMVYQYVAPPGTPSTPVTVYSDATGATTLTQPIPVDSNGLLVGYVAAGQDLAIVASQGGQTAPPALLVPLRANSLASGDSVAAGDRGLYWSGSAWVSAARLGPVYDAVQHGGIAFDTNAIDQSAAINTWLRSLPQGSTAFFPRNKNSPGFTATNYFIAHAVEIPPDITIRMEHPIYTAFTAIAPAHGGFLDTQMLRNWTAADATASGTTFFAPNTTAKPVYYPRLVDIGINFNANNNLTGIALVHPQEQSMLRNWIFSGNTATGHTCIALFCNNDAAGRLAGRVTIRHVNCYVSAGKNVVFTDGTNNGTATSANAVAKDLELVEFNGPTTPPTGATAYTDSPFYFKAVDGLKLDIHSECMAPNGVDDTAGVRLVDCSRVKITGRYSPSNAITRPAVRATVTGTLDAQFPVGPPHIRDFDLYRVTGGPGFSYRLDASCGLNGTTTVTDASVVATDQFRPVYGPGIPSGTKITAVTPGVSFTMNNAALITATVTLKIGSNVIEDETVSGVSRHFQWDDTYFAPWQITDYSGSEIRWLDGVSGGPWKMKHAKSLSADPIKVALAPAGAISESWADGRGDASISTLSSLTSGTLHLVGLPLYPGDKVSNLTWFATGTSLATGSNQWSSVHGPSREQYAISNDHTSEAWAAGTVKTFAMGTPYVASLPALHYAGLLVVATTVPQLGGVSVGALDAQLGAPITHGNSTTALTNPASCPATAGAISSVTGRPYVLAT